MPQLGHTLTVLVWGHLQEAYMKLRFGVMAAASALALTACGDVVQFPGAGDVPTKSDKNDETVVPTDSDPKTIDTPEVVTPPPPSTPEPSTTVIEPGDGETGDAGDTDVDSGDTESGNAETGETDSGDTTTPVDVAEGEDPITPVASIDSLLEVNAQICAASDSPTMTVAQVADADEPPSTFGVAVVNGEAADRVNYPGIVKLEPRRRNEETRRTSSGHCAATRISEQWFITAAHCLDSVYDEVTIVAGVNNLKNPAAKRLTAQTTICHSSYGGSAEEYANDIALIKMAPDAVEFLEDVPIAKYGLTQKLLGATNYPTVEMAGWGLTSFDEAISNELLEATLKTNNVGPAIISIASNLGSGPCVGDSGGPLYVTEEDGSKVLVGMLSVVENNLETNKFCEGQYNGRYTNLQGFLPWVDAVIGVCEGEGGDALCVDG